jgi:signal transduction histidine kinase/CheY-like chemotaxis protein
MSASQLSGLRTALVLGPCGYALIGGLLSLVGWIADAPRLTDWLGTGISIQPNTAVAASGAAAALLAGIAGWRRTSAALGFAVAVVGASALFQHASGIALDTLNTLLMFGRAWGRTGVTHTALMGPAGSTCWTLMGVGVVLASASRASGARRTVPALALVTLSVSTLSIVGYLYGSDPLFSVPDLTAIAFQTATFILVLSLALIAAVPEQAPMRWLVDGAATGAVARRILPFAIVVPPVVGWLGLRGELSGLYDARFGVAVLVLVLMGLLLAVLAWSLATIERHELALRRSERRVAKTYEQRQADFDAITRLQALSTQLVQAGDLTSLLGEILSAAADLTRTSKGNIQLYDPDTDTLRIVVHQGHGERFLQHYGLRGSKDGTGRAVLTRRRVVVEDVAREPRYAGSRDLELLTEDGIRAFQATPLLCRNGELRGVLYSHYSAPHRPTERELRYLDLLARMASDFIERSLGEQALRDADRRKDEFLAMLSHELRNPLAPISNAVQVLRAAGQGGDTVSAASEMMDRQVRQMVRLVDDLLDVSRITRGVIELRKDRVELGSAVRQAVEAHRWLLESMGHALELALPAEPLDLHADRARIVQVLGNLIHNACKFTDRGGRIRVAAAREGGHAVIRVADTGVGIADADLARIFEMFVQLDRSLERSVGGLGIGLTLVKTLVESHGGTVEVRSDGPGRGAEFTVRLPLRPVAQAAAETTAAAPAPPPARRILIVDDNHDSAESLAMMLALTGHETRTAHDGLAAVEAADAFRPDLMLLDIGLPKLDGYDVCRRIRDQEWGKDVVVVAVTGWGQDEDRERSRKAGFDTHFVKPVDPDALKRLIATARSRGPA